MDNKKGKLILVTTPIGNLGDISPRGVKTLEECDFVAAEDTRISGFLLHHFGIKKPMISYFEYNKRERGEEITNRILKGEVCALVTDAGMPAISDPGEDLVVLCYEKNISVSIVPGPSAVVTALAVSGLPTGRFCFEGFLSINNKNRKNHLESLKHETRTMIFYEAPHKILSTLKDMVEFFGEDRKISLVRELTKIYEEVIRTTLKQAVEKYEKEKPRGEFVLVISGGEEEIIEYTLEEAVEIAKSYSDRNLSSSVAAKKAAKETGLKKGDIYRLLNG